MDHVLFIAMLVSKKYLTSVTSRYGISEFNKHYWPWKDKESEYSPRVTERGSIKTDRAEILFLQVPLKFRYNITPEAHALLNQQTAWNRIPFPKLRVPELITEIFIIFILLPAVIVNSFFRREMSLILWTGFS